MPRPPRRSPVSDAIRAAAKAQLSADLPEFPATPLPADDGPEFVVLVGVVPEAPKSINATAGRKYATSHTHKKLWEHLGHDLARTARTSLIPFRGHRVRFTLALPVTRPDTSDGANYASGVSAKACVDGLTRSGLIVPDDCQRWVDVAVVLWRGGEFRDEIRVKVEVIPPAEDPANWPAA